MRQGRVYLDHNASAPLLPAAREAVLAALDLTGNASSVHAEGRTVRGLIEDARRQVAGLTAGGRAEHVVFTSGATEAAATLLSPDWTMGRAPLKMSRLYVSATDHPCILNGGRFAPADVITIGVDRGGVLKLEQLEAALALHDHDAGLPLVAIHLANNETGVVQPVEEIGRIAKDAGAIVVLDAVQAVGRISLDITSQCADFLIISSHKIGGPKGAGAIIRLSDLMMPRPLISGGGQEKGHRSGTENVAAVAGFGVAAAFAREAVASASEMVALRDRFETEIRTRIPDAVFYGAEAPRLPNTSFFAIPGLKAETAQIAFDLASIALSAGSACSSGKVGPSHVLKAMGFGEDASALRVSIGPETGEHELAVFAEALSGIAARRHQTGIKAA